MIILLRLFDLDCFKLLIMLLKKAKRLFSKFLYLQAAFLELGWKNIRIFLLTQCNLIAYTEYGVSYKKIKF